MPIVVRVLQSSELTIGPGHYRIMGCLRFPGTGETVRLGLPEFKFRSTFNDCYFTSQPVGLECQYPGQGVPSPTG